MIGAIGLASAVNHRPRAGGRFCGCGHPNVVEYDDGAGGDRGGCGPYEGVLICVVPTGAVPLVVFKGDRLSRGDVLQYDKGEIIVAVAIETDKRNRTGSE